MARKDTDNVEVMKTPEQANVSENLTSADDASQAEHLNYSRSRCGGALRIAREKQGLSLNDVTSRLKISNKQLEAIEADNFAALPEATIVKGFIRNYAKLLKLDAEPLLDAYNVLVPNREPLAFAVKPSSTMRVGGGYKKTNTGRYIALGVVLVLSLAVWFFYQHYIEKPSPTAPSATIEKLEPPEQALPAAERMEQQPTEIILPPANSGDSLSAPQSLNAPESLSAVQTTLVSNAAVTTNVQTVSDTSAVSANAPVADNSMIRLELAASQETWVSVVDAKGQQIYNKNIFAGGREMIEANAPLELVVGNAAGATVVVNGKSVDLAPHTRSNVTRLKLE